MKEQERSASGEPIKRYQQSEQKLVPVCTDSANIEAICNHIEKHIGTIDTVFHELVSDIVHIDVHWIKPSETYRFHTLVTSGMSDKPMNTPPGMEENRYAELCILLPQEWDIDETGKSFENESNYWPIRWLKTIARFPHEYNTWVNYGHTIPNGEQGEPFAANTGFGCMILLPGLHFGNRFFELEINNNKTIQFYCLYPLYKEEMDFKLKHGLDALLGKFDEYKVSDVVDIKRINTCSDGAGKAIRTIKR